MEIINPTYWEESTFAITLLFWLYSTYRSSKALLGFLHILSDVTRLKVFEFSDPVAYETLRNMGEQNKTMFIMPKMAFNLMAWSLVWVLCLSVMFGLLLFRV